MGEITLEPVPWLILGVLALAVAAAILFSLFYDVRLGRSFGFFIANMFKSVSPNLGAAMALVVENFIWF